MTNATTGKALDPGYTKALQLQHAKQDVLRLIGELEEAVRRAGWHFHKSQISPAGADLIDTRFRITREKP